jgi:hypothetical protein
MSEFERFTPTEARQEAKTENVEKPKFSPETIRNIRHGPPETAAKPETTRQPEATGERIHWRTPDGNLITPEKEELYRSPETLPEKEPGYGPKPFLSDDPGKMMADDQDIDDIDEE